MAKRKAPNPFQGRWMIESMTDWDEDFLHAEVPAYIEFGKAGTGQFQFGYVRGDVDYALTEREGREAVELSWQGFDEMEPESGYGWAVVDGDRLTGMLAFEDGSESGFRARRAEGQPERKQK
jgi:hypothetical protein